MPIFKNLGLSVGHYMLEGAKIVDGARIVQAEGRCAESSKIRKKAGSMANVVEHDNAYTAGVY